MVEGILGEDIKMGEEVWNDDEFLEKVKEICVNNRIKWINREELREFLENVKGILVNNPNEFVTIKDIANDNAIKEILEKKWNLCNDPDYVVRWFLCIPIDWLSPYILYLECRDHVDYARWALKYNPDKQKNCQDRRLNHVSQGLRQSMQKVYDSSKRLYDLTIEAMVKEIFPDIELEEKLKRDDKQLDDFEKSQERHRRSLLDEERGDSWRK